MNRREFVRSLAATAAVPALPMPAFSATPPLAISKATRFWAVYMTHLHGDVTPGMLCQMTGIAPAEATAARSALIADKVIRPIGFVQKGIATTTAAHAKANAASGLRDKLENAFDVISDIGDDPDEPTGPLNESIPDDAPDTPEDADTADRG